MDYRRRREDTSQRRGSPRPRDSWRIYERMQTHTVSNHHHLSPHPSIGLIYPNQHDSPTAPDHGYDRPRETRFRRSCSTRPSKSCRKTRIRLFPPTSARTETSALVRSRLAASRHHHLPISGVMKEVVSPASYFHSAAAAAARLLAGWLLVVPQKLRY